MSSALLRSNFPAKYLLHQAISLQTKYWPKSSYHLHELRTYKHAVKGVIFDMGGVILPSAFSAIQKAESDFGLPSGTIGKMVVEKYSDDNGPWGTLEKGEVTIEEFKESLKFPPMISKLLARFFDRIHTTYAEPLPEMVDLIKCLRAEGILVGLLTNNWLLDKDCTFMPLDRSLFDQVVESARVNCRKPGEEIYNLTLKQMGISPSEAVFIDDMRRNVATALSLGWQGIEFKTSKQTIEDLEKILKIPLQGYVRGSVSVKEKLKFDVESLAKYLKKTLDITIDGDMIVRQFEHGQSNPTYYIKSGETEFVLRKKPPGKLLPSAHAVEREYRVMMAMYENGVPVPKPILLCEDETVIGTPFYIMEYVKGRIFKDPSLPGMMNEVRKEIYQEVNVTLAKIHQVDVSKAGLEDYGKHGNYVKRQTETWTKQYEASKTHEIKAMDDLISWLRENVPQSDRTTVVHGDFRIDNLVFDENECKVLAILDWELSTLGDPITDLAMNCLPYYLSPKFPILKGLSDVDVESMGIPSCEDYIKEYCTRMDIQPIDNWNVYMAFTLFRVAAILQGVYKRSLKGQQSSSDAQKVGLLAESMAKAGWSFTVGKSGPQSKRNYNTSATHTSAGRMPTSSSDLPSHVQELLAKLKGFMKEHVFPNEKIFEEHQKSEDCWTHHPLMDDLKRKAKAAGLWNLFIPVECDPEKTYGAGLTNVEYAFLCEEMGKSIFAPEMFNCSAPDTGNMEVLIKYGSQEQKDKWLQPLLDGRIRSCFAMTEPDVASSDATNIQSKIEEDGETYVLNGRKWWTSGAIDPRCELAIFMGKTDPSAAKHKQQSMVLVPFKSPGVKIIRPLSSFGYLDPPCGHGEVEFKDVRVPKSNMILGPGRGFEIAQGRLGPGRIHHCMRMIGYAERSLALMIKRVKSRVVFGKPLVEQGKIIEDIAKSRIDIEQARLLTLKAAQLMDTAGNKVAAPEIAMIKVVAPAMAQNVTDRAIQAFGGAGVSSDFPMAQFWAMSRILRLADGPDEVHRRAVARMELKKHDTKW